MGNRTRSLPRAARLVGVLAAVVGGATTGAVHAQAVRDYISIVGSSTVYPFATVVAENFGRRNRNFKTPKIESTGSGGGIKAFCSGVGVGYPDIANSSRRIMPSEVEVCAKAGVAQIIEIKIGYDGIVLANAKSAPQYKLSLRDVYLALAKSVPDPAGAQRLVPNPYTAWNQINAQLPAVNIEVLGPPPTSGTRDAFLELVMDPGCRAFPLVAGLESAARQAACHTLREDGRYQDAGENDNLLVQRLEKNPQALGVFGYSFLEQNGDKVQGSVIDGVLPDFDTIADGAYPVARPLYFYVKKAHVDVIPGIREYLQEFTSDSASGEFGYLSDKGLIPLPEEERAAVAAQAKNLTELHLAAH